MLGGLRQGMGGPYCRKTCLLILLLLVHLVPLPQLDGAAIYVRTYASLTIMGSSTIFKDNQAGDIQTGTPVRTVMAQVFFQKQATVKGERVEKDFVL